MRTLLEIRIAGVCGDKSLILEMSCGPSSPGMAMSAITRSTPPCANRARASSPLVKLATRYPRVSSMILRWERDCSLSSTHRIVRLGFIRLPHLLGRGHRIQQSYFLNMKSEQSEMNANGDSPAL